MFVGHTRFSLFTPGKSMWKASRQAMTVDEYTEYLYSKERLDFRRKIFLETSLPILSRAAENHEVTHVVSFSSNLPEEYKNDLFEAAEKFDFLSLNELSPEATDSNWFEKVADRFVVGDVFATYRLDDDDLVSVDYFNRLSNYVNDSFAGMIVSFGRGISAVWDGEKYTRPKVLHKPLLAIGLAEVHKKTGENQFVSPKKMSHMKSDLKNAVILDSRGTDFFWTRSYNQDTSYGADESILRKKFSASISGLENASPEEIQCAFPNLDPLIEYPTLTKLVEEPAFVSDEISLHFQQPRQRFEVGISYRAESGVNGEAYLIVFDLRDVQDNRPVDKVVARGISRSPGAPSKFFRKSGFEPGNRSTRFSLELPDNVICAGISVVKAVEQAGEVTLNEVTLQDF